MGKLYNFLGEDLFWEFYMEMLFYNTETTVRIIESSNELEDIIGSAFIWAESERGHDFWSDMRKKAGLFT